MKNIYCCFFLLIFIFIVSSLLQAGISKKDVLIWSGDFRGGLAGDINELKAHSIKPYSCLNIENSYYNNIGELKFRRGFERFVNLGIKKNINNLKEFKTSNNQTYYLASLDTEIVRFVNNNDTYLLDLDSNVSIESYSNFKRDMVQFNNLVIIGDGVNPNIKYNGSGTTTYEVGIDSPTSDFTLSQDVSIGNVDFGTYKYLITYYSDRTSDNWLSLESDANTTEKEITIEKQLQENIPYCISVANNTSPTISIFETNFFRVCDYDTTTLIPTIFQTSDDLDIVDGQPVKLFFQDYFYLWFNINYASLISYSSKQMLTPFIYDTDYYLCNVSNITKSFKLATTKENALNGLYTLFTEEDMKISFLELNLYYPNNCCLISNLPVSSEPFVTHKKIYRTKANGSVYYLLDTISNSTTTYIDTKNDTELTTEYLTPYGREKMPPCNIFYVYKNRLFASGNSIHKNRLYFSNYNKLEEYDSDFNYIDIANNEPITGLTEVNDHLIIFTKNKTITLYLPDEYVDEPITFDGTYFRYNWRLQTLDNTVGCITNKGIAKIEKGAIFTSLKGIKTLGIKFVGDQSSEGDFGYISEEIKTTYRDIIKNYENQLCCAYDNEFYYLSYPQNGIYNNKIFVYNTLSGKGTFFTGINSSSLLYSYSNEYLLAGSSLKDGLIYKLNENLYDGEYYFNAEIDTLDEKYITEYSDSLPKYIMDDKLSDDITDTNIINMFVGSTLYVFDPADSTYYEYSAIVENGTNYVITRDVINNCTEGFIVKSGTRHGVTETVYFELDNALFLKTLQYACFDITGNTASFLVKTTFSPSNISTYKYLASGGAGFYLNNHQYLNDKKYLNDFGVSSTSKLINYNFDEFNRIKLKIEFDEYNYLDINNFYFIWQPVEPFIDYGGDL